MGPSCIRLDVFGVSVACALALGASPASAVVIDFESLMQVGPASMFMAPRTARMDSRYPIPGGGLGFSTLETASTQLLPAPLRWLTMLSMA